MMNLRKLFVVAALTLAASSAQAKMDANITLSGQITDLPFFRILTVWRKHPASKDYL